MKAEDIKVGMYLQDTQGTIGKVIGLEAGSKVLLVFTNSQGESGCLARYHMDELLGFFDGPTLVPGRHWQIVPKLKGMFEVGE